MSAPCEEHALARDRQGYARTSFEGQLTGLHRKIYCQSRNVPLASIAGLVVRHTCDNIAAGDADPMNEDYAPDVYYW